MTYDDVIREGFAQELCVEENNKNHKLIAAEEVILCDLMTS